MSTTNAAGGEQLEPRSQLEPFDLAALLSRADPFLRALVDTLAEGVLVQVPPDLRAVAGNPAAERILGMSMAEMLATNPSGTTSVFASEGTPLPFSQWPVARALATGRAVRDELLGMQRADGSVVWMLISCVPLKSPQELTPFAIVTTFSDVTERRRGDEALRSSERQLRLALAAARMSVWDWDLERDELRWSAGETLGLASQSRAVRAIDLLQLVHPEDRARAQESLRAILRGTRPSDPFELELRVLRPDGNHFRGRATGRAERRADGRVSRITGTLADVTKQHLLEAELHLARRMESLGRLAGGIAHDFNNLLAVMMSGLEAAREMTPPNAPLQEDLAAATESAERARQLTRQLLGFARRQPVVLSELDVNALLGELSRLLKQLLTPCTLELLPAVGIAHVRADPTQLERVVLNLAANARDAMPRGGCFTLSTEDVQLAESPARTLPAGRYVAIVARDSGVGMGAEIREHLFEPFFTTKPEGNGLGLASSYGLVRQLGGDIEVESAAGKGSTFRILLPAAPSIGDNA